MLENSTDSSTDIQNQSIACCWDYDSALGDCRTNQLLFSPADLANCIYVFKAKDSEKEHIQGISLTSLEKRLSNDLRWHGLQ